MANTVTTQHGDDSAGYRPKPTAPANAAGSPLWWVFATMGCAVVFGFAYGGVMPLYAVLAREYFGQRILGTVLGAATMVSTLGMALGPLGGGWIFDRFGGYAWLYIGSFALGMGAVAIALAFPPIRRLAPARRVQAGGA